MDVFGMNEITFSMVVRQLHYDSSESCDHLSKAVVVTHEGHTSRNDTLAHSSNHSVCWAFTQYLDMPY